MIEEELRPRYWKTMVKISIRKDMELSPGNRFAWFCWLGEPGDKNFKEFASQPFTDISELSKDLIKFLTLFISENGAEIDGYKFSASKVVTIIGKDKIQAIKNEIVSLIHCHLESDV